MSIDLLLIAVVILIACACIDLTVGVSNDAVNFLNSPLASRAAPRKVILIIASLGIIAGVTFSSGMMEVARKGIFHPHLFTMPELLSMFLAVMLTDIFLLDSFNTFGLPTSTTVSIVFELLGAAVAVSIFKILMMDGGLVQIGEYINTAKAMLIIFGILLSVVVAFVFGAICQFFTRLLFTFKVGHRLKKFGALWGGVALSSITFFILIKGSKGASFMSPESVAWISNHTFQVLFSIFVVSVIILQALLSFFKVNIFKPIILIGTFALAMAFAANDLVNFIGVPLAGLHSYQTAVASSDPLNITMEALGKKFQTETFLLLIAGLIMVFALWFSRKARTVSKTELGLGRQEEGIEKFGSNPISRIIVRMVLSFFNIFRAIVPLSVRTAIFNRINPEIDEESEEGSEQADEGPFDLVRASVNLMVASAVISYATSMKLPLSTTYVTFMVSMGTSFSDQAWGRESAVYRVSGVLTVIGGWFVTALVAFSVSFIFAGIIFYTKAPGVLGVMVLVGLLIYRNHFTHKTRSKAAEKDEVFNLKKIKNAPKSITITFQQMAYFLREIGESLDIAFEALFRYDLNTLSKEKKKVKVVQEWANILIANIFKTLRLLQKGDPEASFKYAQTIRRLQKLADGHRDAVLRAYTHVSNNHKGLLPIQVEQLRKVKINLLETFEEVELIFEEKNTSNISIIMQKHQEIRILGEALNEEQLERICNRTSKTRLSILFYALMGDAIMLSKQNLKLLEIFHESFTGQKINGTLKKKTENPSTDNNSTLVKALDPNGQESPV